MISIEDIIENAAASMIKFNEEELKEVQVDLSEVLKDLEKVTELELDGVEPLNHIQNRKQKFREDEVNEEEVLSRDAVLQNTKDKKYGFFTVKNIMD